MAEPAEPSETKQAERQVALVNFAMNHVKESAYLVEKLRFIYVNDEACRTLGYTRQELLQMTVYDVDPNFTKEVEYDHLREMKKSGSVVFETLQRRKDGSIFPAEISSSLFEFEGTVYDLSLVRDITERKKAEESLLKREQEFRLLTENSPDSIARYDLECRRIYVNPAFAELAGKPEKELLGKKPSSYPSPLTADYEAKIREAITSRKQTSFEYFWTNIQGEPKVSQVRFMPEVDGGGKVTSVLGVGIDLTAIRKVQDQVKKSEEEFRTLVENSPDTIARYDRDCKRVYANPALVNGMGKSLDRVFQKTPLESSPQMQQAMEAYEEKIREVLKTGKEITYRLNWEGAEEERWSDMRLVPEFDSEGVVSTVLAIGRDISLLKEVEDRLTHLATHDALTGLPNRNLFYDRLNQALFFADRNQRRAVLMLIDLDNFKNINDTLGHPVGDQLLKQVARQMLGVLRAGDTVARLGGDEFVIVMQDVAETFDVEGGAEKILRAIATQSNIMGHHLYINSSMGIVVYPDDGKDSETLMRNVDTAMYFAKDRGRNGFCRFSEDMNEDLSDRLDLAAGIRQALEKDEFELHYQPKVSLVTGSLTGMEALIRWRHPEKGLIPPTRFIPVAEEYGLIKDIGQWVIETACRQLRTWLDLGLDPLRIAVNLSAAQSQTEEILGVVSRALSECALEGDRLEVEITESMVMQDAERAIQTFWKLKDLGLTVAIDDFGTGHSSLSYLKRFPINCLKVDKSFVDDILIDPSDAEIVRAIITLAHSLNLLVVAEGVENREQLDFLRTYGCEEIQGFLYCKPLPVREMTTFLREGKGLPIDWLS